MDLKTLGVAMGSLGAVAALSFLRAKSTSLVEEDAPETQRAISPDVVHRYDRAYSKFMNDEIKANYYSFLRNIQMLRDAREKVAESLEDVVRAEEAIDESRRWLDKISFQIGYVDEAAEMMGNTEPRDLARMKAYRSFVLSLDGDSAQKFAELAGEPNARKLFERWAR